MRRATLIALLIGLAGMAAAVIYAGAGAVAQTLERLGPWGLLLLMLLHLPAVAMMGLAWWLASGDAPAAGVPRFLWARLVRDAGSEVLPFQQLGGILLGLRALGRSRTVVVQGAVSASVDGIVELTAKLPYVLAALMALAALAPHSHLARPLWLALGVTAGFLAVILLARRSLAALLERAALAMSRRLPAMLRLDEAAVGPEIRATFARILLKHGRLWSAFVLHLLCWCFGAVETWVTFQLLALPLTWAQALAIDGAVMGLRTFGLWVPAAAGVQEASYLVAAAVFGIPPSAAIAAALTRRARDLALGVATLGIAVMGRANFAVLTLVGLPTLLGSARAAGGGALPGPAPGPNQARTGAADPGVRQAGRPP